MSLCRLFSDFFRLFQTFSDFFRLFQTFSDLFRLFQNFSDFRLFQPFADGNRGAAACPDPALQRACLR